MNRTAIGFAIGCVVAVLIGILGLVPANPAWGGEADVTRLATPSGGIQPQVAVGADGAVNLVYFKGEPAAGDLFHVWREVGSSQWTAQVQVNSQSGSSVATGTIRGAKVALGKDDRLHVVWNGSAKTLPKTSPDDFHHLPLLYTHLDPGEASFAPERNLITEAWGLDGGGSIAADGRANVYAVWHAGPEGQGEAARGVYVARSRDGGVTFEAEKKVSPEWTGACGCCGMEAATDRAGNLFIIFRGAGNEVHRDAHLLVSSDQGESFELTTLGRWEVNSCPMSSFSLVDSQAGMFAAWETKGQVFFAEVGTKGLDDLNIVRAPGSSKRRKHPVATAGPSGEILFAWSEGAAWAKGGRAAWQRYDAEGQPIGASTRGPDLPAWSQVRAFTQLDGTFAVIY